MLWMWKRKGRRTHPYRYWCEINITWSNIQVCNFEKLYVFKSCTTVDKEVLEGWSMEPNTKDYLDRIEDERDQLREEMNRYAKSETDWYSAIVLSNMLDSYLIYHIDSKDQCDIDLIKGSSSWIRWIPETIAECDSLECMDCRKSLVSCCSSDRSHNKCAYRDTLPKTIQKQSSIIQFV